MALSLKDKETDRLARAVAALTDETLTDAIRKALAERLERERLRGGRNHAACRPPDADRHALRCLAGPRYAPPQSVSQMSSSSFDYTAALSRFWVFGITKTIKNVMTVVPVLIISCPVSEY